MWLHPTHPPRIVARQRVGSVLESEPHRYQVSFAYAKALGPVCPLVPERASGGWGELVKLAPVWN